MSLYQLERDGDVQELIGLARRSDNPELRARAAELLGNFPDHDDREDVVNALVDVANTDDSAEVTAAAVDALDSLGGDGIERLIADVAGVDFEDGADWVKAKAYVRALDADLPELRMAAANGLGNLEQGDTVPNLVDTYAGAVRLVVGPPTEPAADRTDSLESTLEASASRVHRTDDGELIGVFDSRQRAQDAYGDLHDHGTGRSIDLVSPGMEDVFLEVAGTPLGPSGELR